MAATVDSKSTAARRGGSSPSRRTKKKKMESINFKFILEGSYCNSWPEISVSIGNSFSQIYTIAEQTEINVEVNCPQDSNLTFGLINKSFGNNNMWDTTIDADVSILADKFILIQDIQLNEVSILDFLDKYEYMSDQGNMKIYDHTLRFNGVWDIKFNVPIYNWIINQRKIFELDSDQSNYKSYFSNYKKIHKDYDNQLKLILKLKKILKEIK